MNLAHILHITFLTGYGLLGVYLMYLLWKETIRFIPLYKEALDFESKSKVVRQVFLTTVDVLWMPMLKWVIIGLLLSRLLWMLEHFNMYSGLRWDIYPFVTSQGQRVWFTYMPFRFLRFFEGIDLIAWFVISWFGFISISLGKYVFKVSGFKEVPASLKTQLLGYLGKMLFFSVLMSVWVGFIRIVFK